MPKADEKSTSDFSKQRTRKQMKNNNEQHNELAGSSNSPLEVKKMNLRIQLSEKYGFVSIKIDRLTIMANVELEENQSFQKLCQYWEVMELRDNNEYAGFYGQLFPNSSENFYVSYTPLKAKKMKTKNFYLEFNPAKSSKAHLKYVFDYLLPILDEISISRIDIALDFERDLSSFILGGRSKKKIYFGLDGKIETRYAGSGDEFIIRLYDKKKERIEKGDKVAQDEVKQFDQLWRLEFELHGSGYIENQLKKEFRFLAETPISKLDYTDKNYIELSPQEKILFQAKDEHPELFAELSKVTKAKYNALRKKASIVDLADMTRLPFELTEICWDYPQEIDLIQFLNGILDKGVSDE